MTNKVKIHQRDVFDIIKSSVDKTVNLIKPTYGPASNKVMLAKAMYGMNTPILDDGVQIARDLELEDPAEHAVMKVVRRVAVETNDRVGDGTTGALIMLQAIIDQVARKMKRDGRQIEKELKSALVEVKEQLKAQSRQVKSKEDLQKVARISFDDEVISEKIAEAWHKLGKDGILTVDKSNTMETFVELEDGITVDRGYVSQFMVDDIQKMQTVIEKPYILFTDYRLTEANDVIPIMEKMLQNKISNLVIYAENVEQAALQVLVINRLQKKFNSVAVTVPGGADKLERLEDMALMCGGKVFSEKKGNKLEFAEIEDLGRAERFITRKNESIIVGPKGSKKDVKNAIVDLKTAISLEKNEKEKKKLKTRLARLNHKVGVIKVGAVTEDETKALKYKVEDAVNAVQAAYKSGVACGGGMGLARIETSSELLNNALQMPFRQLCENVGLDKPQLNKNQAINVVTGEIGDWFKVGVMDPVDVLIAQVESAISIASLLVTTSGMIVEEPEHLKHE